MRSLDDIADKSAEAEMHTFIIRDELSRAAEVIRNGGLVAVPTETVYGLAANAFDPDAVQRIYDVKGRPEYKPISLLISGMEDVERLAVNIPGEAKLLAERFWPGPLTMVLRKDRSVPEIVTAGGDTVGLRCPDHPQTLGLIKLAGLPLAAPSANPSGSESPKDFDKVMEYFDGKIDCAIDGGRCSVGSESTILDMTTYPFRIIRQGSLPREKLASILGEDKIL